MLLSLRGFEAPTLGARLDQQILVHTRYRVFQKRSRGLISDDAFFERRRPLDSEHSQLIVLLSGEIGVRTERGTHTLREGEYRTQLRNQPWGMRSDTPHDYLLFEWEPGTLGTRLVTPDQQGSLSPQALAAIRAVLDSEAIASRGAEVASHKLASILRILRAEGLPFDPLESGDLREPVPPWAIALNRAVDQTISSLRDKPRLVDLRQALGWSERQILRRLQQFQALYACHPTGGWRDLQRWWRLQIGLALMAMPKTRTEEVADLLGYATPAAFCEAFANAGLPSPGSVRRVIRAL